MTNVKCTRCGVVNLVSDEVCRVCGVELRPARPFDSSPPYTEPKPNVAWADQSAYSIPTLTPIPHFWGVGDVLGTTISLFFKNFWLITKIVFVIVAPFEIFKILSITRGIENDWQISAGMFMLGLVCKVLIAPALIYALMKLLQTGAPAGVAESYRWGLSKLSKLILCAIMVGILEVAGLILLVIPGIILMLVFQLVYPVAILEEGSSVDSLTRSYNLTKGFRWKILGTMIVMGMLFGVMSVPISALPAIFIYNDITFWPLSVMAAILVDILDQATTVLSLVMYLSILRTLESGRTQY